MLRSARSSSRAVVASAPRSAAGPRTTARTLLTSTLSSTPCPQSLTGSSSRPAYLQYQTRTAAQLSPSASLSQKPAKSSPILPRHSRFFHASSYRMAETRAETDAFGEVHVPADKYWGAQTERSLENFKINQPQDRMPPPIVKAFGILKGAAATVNMQFGLGRTLSRCQMR